MAYIPLRVARSLGSYVQQPPTHPPCCCNKSLSASAAVDVCLNDTSREGLEHAYGAVAVPAVTAVVSALVALRAGARQVTQIGRRGTVFCCQCVAMHGCCSLVRQQRRRSRLRRGRGFASLEVLELRWRALPIVRCCKGGGGVAEDWEFAGMPTSDAARGQVVNADELREDHVRRRGRGRARW